MKCPSCGAPLPAGRAQCGYCGITADVDFAGKSVSTTQPPEHPRTCPACEKAMDSLNIGQDGNPFFIERCPSCLGLFFDPGELEAVIDREVPPVSSVDHLALSRLSEQNGGVVRYRKCPVCGTIMNRINYGQSSGVIADVCRDHGIYLDAGELRRIISWVRAGGRISAAQKAAAEASRASQEIKLPAGLELGIEQEAELAFPRLGTFLLRWLRDKG